MTKLAKSPRNDFRDTTQVSKVPLVITGQKNNWQTTESLLATFMTSSGNLRTNSHVALNTQILATVAQLQQKLHLAISRSSSRILRRLSLCRSRVKAMFKSHESVLLQAQDQTITPAMNNTHPCGFPFHACERSGKPYSTPVHTVFQWSFQSYTWYNAFSVCCGLSKRPWASEIYLGRAYSTIFSHHDVRQTSKIVHTFSVI